MAASANNLSPAEVAEIYSNANRAPRGTKPPALDALDALLADDVRLMAHQAAAVHWMLAREETEDRRRAARLGSGDKKRAAGNGGGGSGNAGREKKRGGTKKKAKVGPSPSSPPDDDGDAAEDGGLDPEGGAVGGMLCDEPGLGKTLTTLGCVLASRGTQAGAGTGGSKPTLIVSPTPVIAAQWASEVSLFSREGAVRVMHYTGPPKPYTEASASALVATIRAADVVLTDLGTVRKENNFRHAQASGRSKRVAFVSPLFEVRWRRVVVDEVQDVEGQASAAAQMLRSLETEQRWGVSGTAITNGLGALKGLAAFLGLAPYSDGAWWADHVDLKPRAPTPPTDAATDASAAARAQRQALLRRFAQLHMWRSRQQDVPAMPRQVLMAPLRVAPSQAEFALLHPHMHAFVRAAFAEVVGWGWTERDHTPLTPVRKKYTLTAQQHQHQQQ